MMGTQPRTKQTTVPAPTALILREPRQALRRWWLGPRGNHDRGEETLGSECLLRTGLGRDAGRLGRCKRKREVGDDGSAWAAAAGRTELSSERQGGLGVGRGAGGSQLGSVYKAHKDGNALQAPCSHHTGQREGGGGEFPPEALDPPWPQGPLAPGQPLQGRDKDAQPGLAPSTGLGWEDAKERNGAAPSPGELPV